MAQVRQVIGSLIVAAVIVALAIVVVTAQIGPGDGADDDHGGHGGDRTEQSGGGHGRD